jgi:hypothetical protein
VRRQGITATLYELDAPSPSLRIDGAAGRIVAADEGMSRMAATVDAAGPATLVWSRTAFPAWRATVDGAAVTIVAAGDHLVGVPLPAGVHRVDVWWPAGPVIAGFVLAALGLIVTVLLAWRR